MYFESGLNTFLPGANNPTTIIIIFLIFIGKQHVQSTTGKRIRGPDYYYQLSMRKLHYRFFGLKRISFEPCIIQSLSKLLCYRLIVSER
jgi:hypothetical protein